MGRDDNMNKNEDIKKLIRQNRYFNYEIAEAIGINEVSFSRWFRRELTEEQKQQIINALEALKGGDNNGSTV